MFKKGFYDKCKRSSIPRLFYNRFITCRCLSCVPTTGLLFISYKLLGQTIQSQRTGRYSCTLCEQPVLFVLRELEMVVEVGGVARPAGCAGGILHAWLAFITNFCFRWILFLEQSRKRQSVSILKQRGFSTMTLMLDRS